MPYDWPEGITADRKRAMSVILHTLRDEGPIESENGRATGLLMSKLVGEGIRLNGTQLTRLLNDMTEGGKLGYYVDRMVSEGGKRTYTIALADPDLELPPDMRRKRPAATVEPDEEEEQQPLPGTLVDEPDDEAEEDEVEDVDVVDLDAVEGLGDDIVRVPVTSTELAHLDAPSNADRILYIISMLNEMLTTELTAPQRTFEDQLDARLTAVNALVEENQRLRDENERLREDKRTLAAALQQSNVIMRSRAAQHSNGTHESVPA